MSPRPLRLRPAAIADLDASADAYAAEAGAVAVRFAAAIERALDHVARHPGTGSLRYSHMTDLPGLRFWPVARFPYLVFYVEEADHVDVWRVLHARRDIPSLLREPEPDEQSGG